MVKLRDVSNDPTYVGSSSTQAGQQTSASEERFKKFLKNGINFSPFSMTLSWSFPLIMLCWRTSSQLNFSVRLYAAFYGCYLIAGLFNGLLIQRAVQHNFYTVFSPTIVSLMSNVMFLLSLYTGNGSGVLTLLGVCVARFFYGWSNFSASEYTNRVKIENKWRGSNVAFSVDERVSIMTPDLQSLSIPLSIFCALLASLLVDALPGKVNGEAVTIIILTVVSFIGSSVASSLLYVATNQLFKEPDQPGPAISIGWTETDQDLGEYIPLDQERTTTPVGVSPTASFFYSWRSHLLVTVVLQATASYHSPRGQMILTAFASMMTAVFIVCDFLLLPYFVIYLPIIIFTERFFPFGEMIIFLSATLFSEALITQLVIRLCDMERLKVIFSSRIITVIIFFNSLLITLQPFWLFLLGWQNSFSLPRTVAGLFFWCLAAGLLKAIHALSIKLLFDNLSQRAKHPAIVASGHQLLGIGRCLLASVVMGIAAELQTSLSFMSAMTFISLMGSAALSLTIPLMAFELVKIR